MKNNNNKINLAGTVVSEPTTYNCCGENFYSFLLSVKRNSGKEDIIPVNISQLLQEKITPGEKIAIKGQVRTYNRVIDNKNRLIITVFAQEVLSYTEDINSVEITGSFCKAPKYRTTPLGRDICDIHLAVNRERGKSDYIPCIVWGRTAAHIGQLNVGKKVSIQGRLQSREYDKKLTDDVILKGVAYEVSVNRIYDADEIKEVVV